MEEETSLSIQSQNLSAFELRAQGYSFSMMRAGTPVSVKFLWLFILLYLLIFETLSVIALLFSIKKMFC